MFYFIGSPKATTAPAVPGSAALCCTPHTWLTDRRTTPGPTRTASDPSRQPALVCRPLYVYLLLSQSRDCSSCPQFYRSLLYTASVTYRQNNYSASEPSHQVLPLSAVHFIRDGQTKKLLLARWRRLPVSHVNRRWSADHCTLSTISDTDMPLLLIQIYDYDLFPDVSPLQ